MRLGREDGFSLVETTVASFMGLLLLGGVMTTITAAYKTGVSNSRTSEALSGARTALRQIEHDLNEATGSNVNALNGQSISLCDNTSSCLLFDITTLAGTPDTIRYHLNGTSLIRDHEFVTGSPPVATFINPQTLGDRVWNLSVTPTVPLFTCSASTSGPVAITIQMALNSHSSGASNLRLNSLVRPRNSLQQGCSVVTP